MQNHKIILAVAALLAATTTADAFKQDAPTAESTGSPAAIVSEESQPDLEPVQVMSRDEADELRIRAVRVERPPSIDGQLDEEIYERVPAITGFIQQEPNEGTASTEDAQIWVLFDNTQLYISARLWQDPTQIVATELRRDSRELRMNDNFAVILDTFRDSRSGFFFYLSAAGGLFEGQVTNESQNNREWNTVWRGRTGRFGDGWTVEMAIPFRSLRYSPGRDQVWGINFRRIILRKNELATLAPVPASYGPGGVQRVSLAATLTGLQVPAVGKNLEIKPYVLSNLITDASATPARSNDFQGDVGFDLKYGVTRGLTADFSYNTDFAQVEDDEQQVNLTRFSLFFPERRDFFLEGQGIFSFGGVRQAGNPGDMPVLFFSRRIGLSRGRPVPLRAGGRLTGRAGPYNIGLVNIQTGTDNTIGATGTNFSAFRLQRDILRRSSIGLLATNRSESPSAPGSSQSAGVDVMLALHRQLVINSYYALTRTPARPGDNASYRMQFNYPTDRYGLQVDHLTVERNFNPEVGFLRRQDIRRNFAQARFSPRVPSVDAIRKLVWQGSVEHVANTRGDVDTKESELLFRAELESSDSASVVYTRNFEFLPDPFEISKDVVLSVGGYDYQRVSASFMFGRQRPVSGTVTLRRGTFYSGDRTEAEYRGKVQFGPRLTIEPRVSLNWIDLAEGSFTTQLLSARTSVLFSPRMILGTLVQYNSRNATLAANLRFHWEYQPDSDFFVVFSEGRDTLGSRELQNRSFTNKFTRLVRF